ncbi:hypothetical protein [Segatella paludivivens]|uniref:hypothetical protein n=1 Tax=Segatella paludivivens TaxID=185294 RepID=UPI000371C068|nr:hypothetical protein [Segatella paludivivens]
MDVLTSNIPAYKIYKHIRFEYYGKQYIYYGGQVKETVMNYRQALIADVINMN